MVMKCPRFHVQLVSKPGSRTTGIGRYAHEIESGLRSCGVQVTSAEILNPVPRRISDLAKRAGYDLDTFNRSFPTRIRTSNGAATHLTSQTLATLLLSQRLPRPILITVHDILPRILRHDPKLSIYHHRMDRLMDSAAMRGLKRADHLIADSHYTKSTIVDTLGIPDERIDVVHLGVDNRTFRPMPVSDSFLARYQLERSRQYVLCVGSEDPRKDVPTALRALKIVRSSLPDTELIKVGLPAFTDQRIRNRSLAEEIGIADAVHWIDAVPEADLPLFYNLAAVLAFPSLYEGFGLPVLEALACGTPVAAVDATSVPEIAGHFATLTPPGDYAALADSMLAILASPPIDQDKLVQHAATFSWSRTVEATLRIYESACA